MALVGAMKRLGVKDITTSAQVPSNDRARLMYYLNCMSSILDLSDEGSLRRLINYQQYGSLSDEEEMALLVLCLALNPVMLDDKCIFQVPEDAIEGGNRFYELTSTETNFVASSSVLIGGTERKVTEIMLYKLSWIQNNYLGPLERISEAKRRENQRREEAAARQRREAQRMREEEAEHRRWQERRRREAEEERNSPVQSGTCTIL